MNDINVHVHAMYPKAIELNRDGWGWRLIIDSHILHTSRLIQWAAANPTPTISKFGHGYDILE